MLNLIGMTTAEGWLIKEAVTFAIDHTGGQNSQCHYVERNGEQAFLKALDIEGSSPMAALGDMLLFQYEGNLVQLCSDRRMSRIVRVLERGNLDRDPNLPQILRFVPYMVFELADGDIRETVDVSKEATSQWRFYILHQATLALLQLHGQDIAHQDVKPSNVLKFKDNGGINATKIKLGDLGRSSRRGIEAPTDSMNCPGALNYAPFELRYGHKDVDWRKRRISADVFHLGCLTVFAFTNVCFANFVMTFLDEAHQPQNWGNSYQEVQAHVVAAMIAALGALKDDFPEEFRSDLVNIVLDLCHPNPLQRGRMSLGLRPVADQAWLMPYVARFDALEKRARIRKPATAGVR